MAISYNPKLEAQYLNRVVKQLNPSKSRLINEERRINSRFYKKNRHWIESRLSGKYIVIAHGGVCGVFDTLEEVGDTGEPCEHRYVFRPDIPPMDWVVYDILQLFGEKPRKPTKPVIWVR